MTTGRGKSGVNETRTYSEDDNNSTILDDISKKEDESRNEAKLLLMKKRQDEAAAAALTKGGTAESAPATTPTKKTFLMPLLTSVMISNLMFLNIATFMPIELHEKHSDIGPDIFAVILAVYNASRLVLSIPIGATMARVGRKNYIIIGFLFLIAATVGYALLDFVGKDQRTLYIVIACFLRFMQGVGGTIL